MNWGKKIYKVLLVLAGPAFAWTSFEMYGLTFGRPQMLFYSITHAMPALSLVVLLSALFFLALFAYNLLLLIFSYIGKNWGVAKMVAVTVLVVQLVHFGLLISYDSWAAIPAVRVPLCIFGLFMVISSSCYVVNAIFTFNNQSQAAQKNAPGPAR